MDTDDHSDDYLLTQDISKCHNPPAPDGWVPHTTKILVPKFPALYSLKKILLECDDEVPEDKLHLLSLSTKDFIQAVFKKPQKDEAVASSSSSAASTNESTAGDSASSNATVKKETAAPVEQMQLDDLSLVTETPNISANIKLLEDHIVKSLREIRDKTAPEVLKKEAEDNESAKKVPKEEVQRSRSTSPVSRSTSPRDHRSRRRSRDRHSEFRQRSHSSSKRSFQPKKEYDDYYDDDDYYDEPYEDNIYTYHNGVYYCKVCETSVNSEVTWTAHLQGKRHAKNLRLQNVDVTALEVASKIVRTQCPEPHRGLIRIKTDCISKIQNVFDDLPGPCPGLDHIIEIHCSPKEITYYCSLCDAPCSAATIIQHVQGHRHSLNCLKEADPKFYDTLKNDSLIHRNRSRIKSTLLKYEQRHGRKQIKVEKDIPVEMSSRRGNEPQPSCSWQEAHGRGSEMDCDDDDDDRFIMDVVPDTSKSDFYCSICDSHMNNISMWEAHKRGKRHLKNVKKRPGELPSKTKKFRSKSSKPKLLEMLEDVDEPVVGLKFIRETQGEAGESYNCYLCGACCTTRDVVAHIVSFKHRQKYLKQIKNPSIDSIMQFDGSQESRANLLRLECANVEEKEGRGEVEVYVESSGFR